MKQILDGQDGHVSIAGCLVSEEGIRIDPEKTKAMQDMEAPRSVSDSRRFMGILNQLGNFIPSLSEKTKPFEDLLSTKNAFH